MELLKTLIVGPQRAVLVGAAWCKEICDSKTLPETNKIHMKIPIFIGKIP